MEKRHRKRVPLACLNCKKRKVRCDKKKPCTGCTKNNVGHLCVYIEPDWAELLAKISQATNVSELVEYRQLQLQLHAMEEAHRHEVEHLKLELARASASASNHHKPAGVDPPTASLAVASVAESLPVTILRKLRDAQDASEPLVVDDHYFTMCNFRRARTAGKNSDTLCLVNLYLWLNIIKLDPQLTALWYKITNLQKSYHIYKTRLLDEYSRGNTDMRTMVSDPPSDLASRPSSPACGHHKCPVVACEFNLMVEESNRTDTPAGASGSEPASAQVSRGGSTTPLGVTNGPRIDIKMEDSPRNNGHLGFDDVAILTRMQRLWAEIRNYGRGNAKLSYEQLAFLLDFYLRDVSSSFKASLLLYEVESQHLFRFFRPELSKLFVRDSNDVRLNIPAFLPEMNDEEVFGQLKVQGVYLLMLALIVEESLDVLRLRRGLTAEVMAEFHSVFPLEAVHQGMGYKHTNVSGLVCEFVKSLSESVPCTDQVNLLMLTICLFIGLLNRLMSVYKKEGMMHDITSAFTCVLTLTLDVLDQKGHRLEIWTDPAQVLLQGAKVSPERESALRVLLCQMWADFMRIVNLVLFSLIPIVKHLQHLDRLLENFLVEITDAEPAHAHISFLKKLSESSPGALSPSQSHTADLITSLHVNYLMARSSMLIRNGIDGRSRVCISDLQKCMAEIAAWSSEITLTKLSMSRYFEVRTMFNYLEFFFSFIVFLQCEENGDNDLVVKLIPVLFAKCLDLNKFLQGGVIHFGKCSEYKYVIVGIAENLARVSHLIAGLLIRFIAGPNGNSQSGTGDSLIYSQTPKDMPPISISVASKDEVIREVDRTIQLLETTLSKGSVHRATKIWRFYMTFIRNSHKMNPAAYAKLHAEAFGSGRIVDACPVLPPLGGTSSFSPASMTSRMTSCPVAHTTASSEMRTEPRRCPVNHMSLGMPAPVAPLEPRKRQCPFDHEALRNSTLGQNFHESNIRGQPEGDQRPALQLRNVLVSHIGMNADSGAMDMQGMARATPPQLATVVAIPNSMFSAQLLVTAAPSSSDLMDWDNLPNFNFDLVGDEALMVQINGGDFNNPAIEGMFQ